MGIGLGALGEPVFRELFDPLVAAWISFALAFAIVTYITVVVGELVPKALALHRAAPIAAVVARPIALLQRIGTPVVWVLQGSARLILRPLGCPAGARRATVHTVDELRGIVAEAEDSGLIEEAEEEMLYRVFDFAGQEAADVMVPSSEVVTLDGSLTVREAVERALEAPHSRFPVVRGSIDDVAGVLALRDLTAALHAGHERTIEPLARDLLVVPDTKDVGALLQEMRQGGAQMALVAGEYGRTMGIVTLNDLIEEIVGEIEEEYGLPDESVQQLDDGRLRIAGSYTSDDFNETFGTRAADRGLPDDRRARVRRAGPRAAPRGRGDRRRRRVRRRAGRGPAHREAAGAAPAARERAEEGVSDRARSAGGARVDDGSTRVFGTSDAGRHRARAARRIRRGCRCTARSRASAFEGP